MEPLKFDGKIIRNDKWIPDVAFYIHNSLQMASSKKPVQDDIRAKSEPLYSPDIKIRRGWVYSVEAEKKDAHTCIVKLIGNVCKN